MSGSLIKAVLISARRKEDRICCCIYDIYRSKAGSCRWGSLALKSLFFELAIRAHHGVTALNSGCFTTADAPLSRQIRGIRWYKDVLLRNFSSSYCLYDSYDHVTACAAAMASPSLQFIRGVNALDLGVGRPFPNVESNKLVSVVQNVCSQFSLPPVSGFGFLREWCETS